MPRPEAGRRLALQALLAIGALLVLSAVLTALRSPARTTCALPATTAHLPCSAANVTDRLHTLWRRADPRGGNHTGTQLESVHLGSTDRIDVFYNASTNPAKATVLFAYRGNKCPDEHRRQPEALFTQNSFHTLFPEGGVFLDIGACYGDTAVQLGVLADQVRQRQRAGLLRKGRGGGDGREDEARTEARKGKPPSMHS